MLLPEPFQHTLSSYQNINVFACVLDTLSILFLLYSVKDGRGRAFATYTLQEVLDEPDVIECFTEPGRSPIQGEVLKKQEQIYREMKAMSWLAAGQPTKAQ